MSKNEKSLFRKSSLERVSSPEQLNEYIKITNPSLMVILLGIFTLLAAGLVWVFSGGIPKTVDLQGVVVGDPGEEQKLYSYVSIADSKRLSEGMKVQISPDYASREEYGYKNGVVTSIGTDIVTTEYLQSKFKTPQIVAPLIYSLRETNYVEVEMEMQDWSSEKGDKIELSEGSICKVSAIIGETKPYELIFNK
ncbi:MAG: hypothetical protein IJJ04_00740 [Clostridia bacterium]|nr:hypothetical protein [Clostridia bacterium]